MAITNAQQYKQLMQNGGRIGLRGGGADMGQEKELKQVEMLETVEKLEQEKLEQELLLILGKDHWLD